MTPALRVAKNYLRATLELCVATKRLCGPSQDTVTVLALSSLPSPARLSSSSCALCVRCGFIVSSRGLLVAGPFAFRLSCVPPLVLAFSRALPFWTSAVVLHADPAARVELLHVILCSKRVPLFPS